MVTEKCSEAHLVRSALGSNPKFLSSMSWTPTRFHFVVPTLAAIPFRIASAPDMLFSR